MTWILDLYQTYEDNIDQVGVPVVRNGKEFALLPVGHAYRNAQIEVRVTPKGEFYDAKVINKERAPTIVPITGRSDSRSSGIAPHPLHDELQYVAGDFTQYVDAKEKKTKKNGEKIKNPYEEYIKQLAEWKDAHYKVRAVYEYLKKGTLISDLILGKILYADKKGKLLADWPDEVKPEIFSVATRGQEKTFVRFDVHDPFKEGNDLQIWEDESVNKIASRHFCSGKEDIDYVTGNRMIVTDYHTSGIRNSGDRAKIISANDSDNFTYLGRFLDKQEVVEVGYEVSQKAHNALKWLITKQSIVRDGRVYLVWGNELPEKLNPFSLSYDFFDDDEEIEAPVDRTQSEYAQLIKEAIYGKNNELATTAKVNIMILDSVTKGGKGRIGILYYNAIDQDQYLQRIEGWQRRSTWRHKYYVNKKLYYSYGAPKLFEISKATFGENANKKILNNATTVLFTRVVENKSVPFDIVKNIVKRASNPLSFKHYITWQQTLSTACSMVNHYYFKGGCQVSLNTESNERNYLFGRLLAVSHVLEKQALNEGGGGSRTTNAERYMNAFSMRPVKTWMIIRGNLQPYINRLGNKAIFYNKLFDEIMNLFNEESFTDKALDGRYLLGYYSQEYAIYNKKTTEEEA